MQLLGFHTPIIFTLFVFTVVIAIIGLAACVIHRIYSRGCNHTPPSYHGTVYYGPVWKGMIRWKLRRFLNPNPAHFTAKAEEAERNFRALSRCTDEFLDECPPNERAAFKAALYWTMATVTNELCSCGEDMRGATKH